ncbi:MAG: hypothetical protein CTY15_04410 [Methylocystis sp.]|nr:MAG: hypothetical protein CTY15_04410 [Methylocystis sp.]
MRVAGAKTARLARNASALTIIRLSPSPAKEDPRNCSLLIRLFEYDVPESVAKEETVMSNSESNMGKPGLPKDKYTGMRDFDFAMSSNVYICAGAGAVLGAILAYWATNDAGIVGATVIVFAILSGIFGMFV